MVRSESQQWNEMLWQQFGASIDMLENAIKACPDELWKHEDAFWYRCFHTLFFLDYYLEEDVRGFQPPEPFGLTELDPAGRMPGRVYGPDELLAYAQYCRNKCRDRCEILPAFGSHARFVNDYLDIPVMELMMYNLRHVQHHVGQLNLLLRQAGVEPPRWVSIARNL